MKIPWDSKNPNHGIFQKVMDKVLKKRKKNKKKRNFTFGIPE